MDGLSVPSQGYSPIGVQPLEPTPSPSLLSRDQAPSAAPTAGVSSRAIALSVPAFTVDFSGVSGGYVLDWRDPRTHAVLVQVPMRTAFPHLDGAATPEHVGTRLDTTA